MRVLQQVGDEALVVLLDPDADAINRLGATALEPSHFQTTAPRAELTDVHGVVREPQPQAG